VNLVQADDLLTLEVVDDGAGFDLKKVDSRESLGFIGIRERLKPFNGKLEIISVINKGTKLNIIVPIN
jgi:two-component system sensor histidine kinase UhpB